MMGILGNSVSADTFIMTLICIVLIAYFCYKEWPEFKKRVSGEQVAKTVEERVTKAEGQVKNLEGRAESFEGRMSIAEERLSRHEERLEEFSDMLSRDYIRLNTVEKLSRANTRAINDSLKERSIIMEALLGCLKALQKAGATAETEEAIDNITEYMLEQAHVNQEIKHDEEAPMLNPNI